MLPFPDFAEEVLLWQQGHTSVAGVDEVGRGAFAGPVVAAAVILPSNFPQDRGVHDSKLLTAQKREELSSFIHEYATATAIAEVPVSYINTFGIGKATQKAFRLAIQKLHIVPEFILVDAFYIKTLRKKIQKPIIKGDQKSLSIAAASIIAKVYRDAKMKDLSRTFDQYGFDIHKGYGTKKHQDCIRKFGLCKLHRTSFNLSPFTTSDTV